MPTVYLDSSVPSYWLPQQGDPIVQARHLITRQWWADELPRFDVYISQIVLEELGGGDPARAAERCNLVNAFPLLDIDETVEHAANYYVDQMAMPRKNLRDAFHLALAAVHDIDYLVTWNYAHLANASKRTHIETLNRRLHLSSPVICSPEELMIEPRE
ncbi:MAG: type II toxin-antitoxin system VapC family toxin [Planctomycetes bacterium]|nr:type II toxin-antitoxin system VapC family toxin [Planctomycetota bacterium]